MKPAKKGAQKSPKSITATGKKPKGFTDEERVAIRERLHAITKANASALSPKTWYGMPAYAKEGNVVCFLQSAQMKRD